MSAAFDQPKRAAILVASVLAITGVAGLVFFAPGTSRWKGMGFSLLLDKQMELRAELMREGRHLNELEIWQVQEELARRSGISRDGVKGLVLRAANAKDPDMQAEAFLLSGSLVAAMEESWKLAQSAAKETHLTAETRARRWQRTGDACWRAGDPRAAEAYANAVRSAPLVLAPALQLDLTFYHWSIASFHPEHPGRELGRAVAAAAEAVALLEKPAHMLDLVAALRLKAHALLRMGLLQADDATDAGKRDISVMQAAGEDFVRALEKVNEKTRPDLWAALQHEYGIALLEAAQAGNPAHLAAALHAFDNALTVRGTSLPNGQVNVDLLEARLRERSETLAFRALTLVLQGAMAEEKAPSQELLQDALDSAKAALELSTADDPGPAWIVAKRALSMAAGSLAREADEMAAKTQHLTTALDAALAALKDYPHDLDGLPGVPERRTLLLDLASHCQQSGGEGMAALGGRLEEVEKHLTPLAQKLDRTSHVQTYRAACSAIGAEMLARAGYLEATFAREELIEQARLWVLRGVSSAQGSTDFSDGADDVKGAPLPMNPWRIPMPQDRLVRDQLQRASDLLQRLGHPLKP